MAEPDWTVRNAPKNDKSLGGVSPLRSNDIWSGPKSRGSRHGRRGSVIRELGFSEFEHLRRDEITTPILQSKLKPWIRAGVKAWTVRHRINALRQLYMVPGRG